MVLMGYNDRWRRQRRLMQRAFDKQESLSFRPAMQIEIDRFLQSIANHSGNVRPRVHRYMHSILLINRRLVDDVGILQDGSCGIEYDSIRTQSHFR